MFLCRCRVIYMCAWAGVAPFCVPLCGMWCEWVLTYLFIPREWSTICSKDCYHIYNFGGGLGKCTFNLWYLLFVCWLFVLFVPHWCKERRPTSLRVMKCAPFLLRSSVCVCAKGGGWWSLEVTSAGQVCGFGGFFLSSSCTLFFWDNVASFVWIEFLCFFLSPFLIVSTNLLRGRLP